MVEAVIRHRGKVDTIPLPDTGCLRSDMLAVLTNFNSRRSRILLAVRLGAYYDEAGTSPKEIRRWFNPDSSRIQTLVQRAVDRGELKTMPPPRVVALPIDLLRNELFLTMAEATRETIEGIIDDVFLPCNEFRQEHRLNTPVLCAD